MLPIQSVRIINMQIPDKNYDVIMKNDYYDYAGDDVLMTLENGGGKSSLILILNQVFKPNARRGKRILRDYVSDAGYSVVSVELSRGNRFTTLNLVARKKYLSGREGGTDQALEFFLFISEYGETDTLGHNPKTLPFFEDVQCKRQVPYEVLEKEILKKPEYFRHYKQNEVKKYMAYLESQFHNVAAWADTIWQINSVEGGASGLFSGSKTDPDVLISSQSVIRDRLIPIIESKNQIDIDQIQQQLDGIGQLYANQFESQARRDRLSEVCQQFEEEFISKTKNATTLTKSLNQATTTYEAALSPLTKLIDHKTKQVVALEEKRVNLSRQFSEVELKQTYLRVEDMKARQEALSNEVHSTSQESRNIQSKQIETEQLITIQQATKQYQDYQAIYESVRLKQEAIEAKALSNQAKSLKIREIQETLSIAGKERLDTTSNQLTQLTQESSDLAEEAQRLQVVKTNTSIELNESIRQEKELKSKLKELQKQIELDWASLQVTTHDVSGNRQNFKDEYEELTAYAELCYDEQIKQETQKEQLSQELKQISLELTKVEASIALEEKEIAKLKEARQVQLLQLSQLLNSDVLFSASDKDIQIQVNERVLSWDREKNALTKEIFLIEQDLLVKREIVIPDVLERWLQEEEIGYTQGIEYLLALENEAEQTKMISSYPMLPHSLVLKNPQDFDRIKQCPVQLTNEMLLLFMVDPAHYLGQPESVWWGIGQYSVERLESSFWEGRRERLELEKVEKAKQLQEIQQSEKQLYQIHSRLQQASIRELQQREVSLNDYYVEENQLSTKKHLQEALLLEVDGSLTEWIQKANQTRTRLEDLAQALATLDRIEAALAEQSVLSKQKERTASMISKKQELLDQTQTQIIAVEQKQIYYRNQRDSLVQTQYQARVFYFKYQDYLPQNPKPTSKGTDLDALEKHLIQLQREVDLTQLEEELAILKGNLNKERLEFELFMVDETICQQAEYSATLLQFLQEEAKRLSQQFVEVSNQLSVATSRLEDLTKELDFAQDEFKQQYQKHQKQYGEFIFDQVPTKDELKEALRFLKESRFNTEQTYQEVKLAVDRLQATLKTQTKLNYFDLNLLNSPLTAAQLEQFNVETFLAELDEAQEQYELQREHLRDALKNWRLAFQKAWRLTNEQLDSLPTGIRKQKDSILDIDMENYLAVIEIVETTILRLQEAILNEADKLKQADAQLQTFSEYLATQCQEVYDQLMSFDRGLSIELNGKMQQILRLHAPLLCLPEQFGTSIQEYVKDFVHDLSRLIQLEQLSDGADKTEARNTVNNKKSNFKLGTLLSQVIDFERTELKVLKVSNLQYDLDAWDNDNSGGQGSLKALILIFTIFKYLNNDKYGTTILMDNPFGKMSSVNLVDAMFKAAKRLNVKLICFTGIEEKHIQQQFNVHYKLSHVPGQSSGTALMRVVKEGEERGEAELERGFYSKTARPTREALQQTLGF